MGLLQDHRVDQAAGGDLNVAVAFHLVTEDELGKVLEGLVEAIYDQVDLE